MRADYAVRPTQSLKVGSTGIFITVLLNEGYQVYLLFCAILFHRRSPLPRKTKRPIDLTTEQAMKKLFPKKVVDKMKEVAHEKDRKSASSSK